MRNILTPFLVGSLLTYLPQAERAGMAKEVFHTFVIGVYFFPLACARAARLPANRCSSNTSPRPSGPRGSRRRRARHVCSDLRPACRWRASSRAPRRTSAEG
jgi:hypothetical protein